MKTIIWQSCAPRSFGNWLSLTLQDGGAETCRAFAPSPNDWNPEFGHDTTLEAMVSHIVGDHWWYDRNEGGKDQRKALLPNPGGHSNPDVYRFNPVDRDKYSNTHHDMEVYLDDATQALSEYFLSKFNQARTHYLFQSNVTCGIYKRLLEANLFPTDTRHVMVTTVRDIDSQVASLMEACSRNNNPRSYKDCLEYILRFRMPIIEMRKDFMTAGCPHIEIVLSDGLLPQMKNLFDICNLEWKDSYIKRWNSEHNHHGT
jgi:hypothetical protein